MGKAAILVMWPQLFNKFRSPCLMKAQSRQKLFEINEIWVTLDKGQRMTLYSGTCMYFHVLI